MAPRRDGEEGGGDARAGERSAHEGAGDESRLSQRGERGYGTQRCEQQRRVDETAQSEAVLLHALVAATLCASPRAPRVSRLTSTLPSLRSRRLQLLQPGAPSRRCSPLLQLAGLSRPTRCSSGFLFARLDSLRRPRPLRPAQLASLRTTRLQPCRPLRGGRPAARPSPAPTATSRSRAKRCAESRPRSIPSCYRPPRCPERPGPDSLVPARSTWPATTARSTRRRSPSRASIARMPSAAGPYWPFHGIPSSLGRPRDLDGG